MEKEKKLTKEQIQNIDNDLIKLGIKYWDLRIELVDHIVLSIEERMLKGESVKDAYVNAKISLGYNGDFKNIVNKRIKAFNKSTLVRLIKTIKHFFTSIEIIIYVSVVVLFKSFSEVNLIELLRVLMYVLIFPILSIGIFKCKYVFKSLILSQLFTFSFIWVNVSNVLFGYSGTELRLSSLQEYSLLVFLIFILLIYCSCKMFMVEYIRHNKIFREYAIN